MRVYQVSAGEELAEQIVAAGFDWGEKKSQHVALGSGRVDPRFFSLLKRSDFDGPISVHVEYLPKASVEENLAAIKHDYTTLRDWLNGSS